MTGAGLDIDTAARQILFRMGLGTHHFLAIAKLRAARQVWSRVVEACGGSPAVGRDADSRPDQQPRADATRSVRQSAAEYGGRVRRGSGRRRRDHLGALRCHDRACPTSFSRRVARNTVLVLQEEAHLHRVIDPAGGSWFLDQLTEQLADKAWEIFQEIERQGGMLAALQSGWIAEQIDAAYAAAGQRHCSPQSRALPASASFPTSANSLWLTGRPILTALRVAACSGCDRGAARQRRQRADVGRRPDPRPPRLTRRADGATIGQMARGARISSADRPTRSRRCEPRSFAEPFEAAARCQRRLAGRTRPAATRVPGEHGPGRPSHGPRDVRQELL